MPSQYTCYHHTPDERLGLDIKLPGPSVEEGGEGGRGLCQAVQKFGIDTKAKHQFSKGFKAREEGSWALKF